jgi:hypothetical protein
MVETLTGDVLKDEIAVSPARAIAVRQKNDIMQL